MWSLDLLVHARTFDLAPLGLVCRFKSRVRGRFVCVISLVPSDKILNEMKKSKKSRRRVIWERHTGLEETTGCSVPCIDGHKNPIPSAYMNDKIDEVFQAPPTS